MHGKQQQRAIPIKHAKTTQKIAKNTSNARKTTASLQKFRIRDSCGLYLHISLMHAAGTEEIKVWRCPTS
jgi:hypothetical protein